MRAEILTIGDELLIGQIINTNQAFIAERLNEIGIAIDRMLTVGDDREAIITAFREGWEKGRVVLATGGLGPTHDDITKKAACDFFGCGLVPDPAVREHIKALLARRNIPWSDRHEEQALVPERAGVIQNPAGTAPCLHFQDGRSDLFLLPGVPYEMREILTGGIIPLLRSRPGRSVIRHRTLRTTGIPESALAQEIGDIETLVAGGGSLAFLPSPTGVRLRISVQAEDETRADELVAGIETQIRRRAGRFVYGVGEEEIEEVVGRLLAGQGLTIAVAESCTGGLIAHRMTNVSGSSRYFNRGVVTYSNASKMDLLGVPAELLERHGAVSEEVAGAMAAGIRRMAGTDLGLATTGIAGPTGGTAEKPVGLCWVGFAHAAGVETARFQFGDGRLRFKERSSQAALDILRKHCVGIR
jgi:nicotinamide-nucleotide amidase